MVCAQASLAYFRAAKLFASFVRLPQAPLSQSILSSDFEYGIYHIALYIARLHTHIAAAASEQKVPSRSSSIMSLPSIKPPVRVLIRTRPAQLQKIHPSFDQADTELIGRLCDTLSLTDKTKISHLITRISDDKKLDDKKLGGKKLNDKKLERVDIIFDYGSTTIEGQPPVIAYAVTVEGPDLIVKQLSDPHIRQFVNLTVKTFESINLENNRCFPSRPDIREETRKQRRAVLPA